MHFGPDLPRIVTPRICAELGITRAQVRTALRRGHWQTIAPGHVLTRPDGPGRLDWAEAGLAAGGTTAALSGWDACRLHGIASGSSPRPTVLVLTRQGRSRTVGAALVRRTDRAFVSTMTPVDADLPLAQLVAPARAVADVALWMRRPGDVRALVASAVQRGLVVPAHLEQELEAGPQQGSGLLRAALDDIADGARSAAEASAARQLRTVPVPPFELNVPVVDESGRVVFVLDVLWRQLRAVLEIDSREYHFEAAAWRATMDRHNTLTRLGCAVAHYPPSVINRRDGRWLTEVQTWLRRRAHEIGVPYRPGRPTVRCDPEPLIARRAA